MMKEYRMLAFVPRWAIAPRHHGQSVAEHSFYVALYASEICTMLDIEGFGRAMVMDAALRHDASEAWESDVPGPAKRSLFDPVKKDAYKSKFAEGMNDLYRESMESLELKSAVTIHVGVSRKSYTVRNIVKVADLIDEVFWLAFEQNLGNTMLRGLYQREMNRLDQAATGLAGEEFAGELMNILGQQIARISEEGAIIPANDTDMPEDPNFRGTSKHISVADVISAEQLQQAILERPGDASAGPSRPDFDIEDDRE